MPQRKWTKRPCTLYAVALVTVVLATLLRMAAAPLLKNRAPFSTYFVALMITGWYGGLGPTLLATLLGTVAAVHFFVEPHGAIYLYGPGALPGTPGERRSVHPCRCRHGGPERKSLGGNPQQFSAVKSKFPSRPEPFPHFAWPNSVRGTNRGLTYLYKSCIAHVLRRPHPSNWQLAWGVRR